MVNKQLYLVVEMEQRKEDRLASDYGKAKDDLAEQSSDQRRVADGPQHDAGKEKCRNNAPCHTFRDR